MFPRPAGFQPGLRVGVEPVPSGRQSHTWRAVGLGKPVEVRDSKPSSLIRPGSPATAGPPVAIRTTRSLGIPSPASVAYAIIDSTVGAPLRCVTPSVRMSRTP